MALYAFIRAPKKTNAPRPVQTHSSPRPLHRYGRHLLEPKFILATVSLSLQSTDRGTCRRCQGFAPPQP